MSINTVTVSGRLTRDAELRQSQGGTPVLSFSLAVNERQRNRQTGEWEDRANFVDCVLFGRLGEAIAPRMTKGAKACVSGRLRYSSWEGRDGQRRSKLEVAASEVELMDAPRQAAPAADAYAADIPF